MEECQIDGCERPCVAKRLCSTHYGRMREGKPLDTPIKVAGGICALAGCDRPRLYRSPDYCKLHYRRWRKTGDPGPAERLRGPDGEGTVSGGYRMLRLDGRLIAEHRLVMERALERPLKTFEHVHHLNGNRLDNRLANLELWTRAHPYGTRLADLLGFVAKHYPDELRALLD